MGHREIKKIISNKEDIVFIEKRLEKFCHFFSIHRTISLLKVSEKFKSQKDCLRIFYAFYDLEIALILQEKNMLELISLVNDYSTKRFSKLNVTKSQIKFNSRMLISEQLNIFILRHRSLWDKFFGVIILSLWLNEYDNFYNAKRKKSFFLKLMAQKADSQKNIFFNYGKLLENFENTFRTPEIHGAGSIRKWIFHEMDCEVNSLEEFKKTNLVKILSFYNESNDFIENFVKFLNCKALRVAKSRSFYIPSKNKIKKIISKKIILPYFNRYGLVNQK